MKKEYSIGFLSVIIVGVLILGIAYDYSYNLSADRMKKEKSMKADSTQLLNDCYYLMEVNGYLVVYHSDKKTPYEYTDILFEELPSALKQEIKNGKYIKNMEELYGFLENYSS